MISLNSGATRDAYGENVLQISVRVEAATTATFDDGVNDGAAFIGASAFGDDNFLTALAATIDFAGFPSRTHGQLKYCASNQVGDAALLYASTLGPIWEKVKTGARP